jgi:MYXO-CTERM domain-containing protein
LIPPAGCGWGAFEQRYFFADYGSNRVWTLDVASDRRSAVSGTRRMFGRVDTAVSFRMGPDGAMYIASFNGGSIKRLAPRSIPATCGEAAAAPTPARDSGASPRPGPAAAGDAGEAAETSDGCGCHLASQRPAGVGALAVMALLALIRWRFSGRRRDARAKSPRAPANRTGGPPR